LRAGKKDGFTFPNYLPRQPGDRDAIETQAQENACAPGAVRGGRSRHGAAGMLLNCELRLAKKRAQVFHSLAAALLRGMWCLNTVLGRAAPDGYTNGVEPSTGLSRALHGDCRCNRFIIWIRYLFALP